MSRIAWRATSIMTSGVIAAGPRTSPASTMRLVVAKVSTPQRACGSAARKVSTIASETRSHTLSGCPSDTDSLVKTKSCFGKMLSLQSAQANAGYRRAKMLRNRCLRLRATSLSRLEPQASSRIVSAGASDRSNRGFVGCPLALCSESSGQVEEAAAHGGILHRIIGVDQIDGFAAAQRIGVERLGRRLGKAARDRRRPHRVHIVKEERDRHIENAAQLMQPAGADAIGAALVFLHLLEGQADRRAKLFLAEPKHIAAQANPGSDLYVDRVGFVRFLAAGPPRLSRYHNVPARHPRAHG